VSYVNLMANDRWTERDHINRTELLVRSQISAEEETIINRKFSGALGGYIILNAQDQADVLWLKQVTEQAQIEGAAARVDAALLHAALDIEQAPDAATRAALEAAASPEVLQLLADRAAWRAAQEPPDPAPIA
jgi:hypothetical protein